MPAEEVATPEVTTPEVAAPEELILPTGEIPGEPSTITEAQPPTVDIPLPAEEISKPEEVVCRRRSKKHRSIRSLTRKC